MPWRSTIQARLPSRPSRDEIDGHETLGRGFSAVFCRLAVGPRNRVLAGSGQGAADSRAWIKASNKHAQVLLDVLARFGPEGAGRIGVAGLDRGITSLTPESLQQLRQASSAALAQLKTLLTAEKDPLVRQDLEILVHSAQNEVRSQQLDEDRLLPYPTSPPSCIVAYGRCSIRRSSQNAGPRRSNACESMPGSAGTSNQSRSRRPN